MTEPIQPHASQAGSPDAPAGPERGPELVTITGPAAVPGIAAEAVDVRLSAVGGIRADQAVVRFGSVGGIAASRAEVRQGSVGGVLASGAEISQAYVGTAAANSLRVERSFVRTAMANTLHAGPSTTIVFLAARRVEGSPRVLFDWRAAAVVAAALVGIRLAKRIRR